MAVSLDSMANMFSRFKYDAGGNLSATMSLPFPDFLLLMLFLKAKRTLALCPGQKGVLQPPEPTPGYAPALLFEIGGLL